MNRDSLWVKTFEAYLIGDWNDPLVKQRRQTLRARMDQLRDERENEMLLPLTESQQIAADNLSVYMIVLLHDTKQYEAWSAVLGDEDLCADMQAVSHAVQRIVARLEAI